MSSNDRRFRVRREVSPLRRDAEAQTTAASSAPASPLSALRLQLSAAAVSSASAAVSHADDQSGALSDVQRVSADDRPGLTSVSRGADTSSRMRHVAAAQSSISAAPAASCNAPSISSPQRVQPTSVCALSIATRCDADALSIMLSFLVTADFLAAIRVCKQWRAARIKQSAWPAFDVDRFIQSLRDDNYDDPARRRLRLQLRVGNVQEVSDSCDEPEARRLCITLHANNVADVLGSLDSAVGVGSSALAAGATCMWRHVTDAHIKSPPLSEKMCDAALQRLAQLPRLAAISLHNFNTSEPAAEHFFSAVSHRLQVVVLLDSPQVGTQVHQLRYLRVLSISGHCTTLSHLSPASVLQLTQLECIRLDADAVLERHHEHTGQALAFLSREHALISVLLKNEDGDRRSSNILKRFLRPFLMSDQLSVAQQIGLRRAGIIPLVADLRASRLRELSFKGTLSSTESYQLQHLLCLNRLSVIVDQTFGQGLADAHMLRRLTHLQQLHLSFQSWNESTSARCVTALQQGVQLRVVSISSCVDRSLPAPLLRSEDLQALLAAKCDTIEVMRLLTGASVAHGAAAQCTAAGCKTCSHRNWSVLKRCAQLRELELPLQSDTPSELFAALASAPSLLSLTLSEVSARLLSSALLQAMASSRSWCSLRLRGSALKLTADDLEDLLPAAQVEASAACRMRIFVYRGPDLKLHELFGISKDERGMATWQQM